MNVDNSHLARKDLNFFNDEKYLLIEHSEAFIESTTKDAEFFEDLNLMDYSLLLLKLEFTDENIHEYLKFKDSRDFTFYDRHIFFSKIHPNIAYVCVIIDYLQDYNFKKQMENNIKNFITERPQNNNMISCVPADVYAKRFIEFIKKITNIE